MLIPAETKAAPQATASVCAPKVATFLSTSVPTLVALFQ